MLKMAADGEWRDDAVYSHAAQGVRSQARVWYSNCKIIRQLALCVRLKKGTWYWPQPPKQQGEYYGSAIIRSFRVIRVQERKSYPRRKQG